MNVTIEQVGDVIILAPAGERLDISTAAEFKNYIATAVDPAAKTVFDMSQLRFVDSTGLGAVVTFLKQSKNAGGDLKLCGMSKPVRKLFELVRVHKIVDIFETREEALSAFQSSR